MALHTGHRSRVKGRIMAHGAEPLLYHEKLEALLFYIIPYKDTNPLAHAIANRYPTVEKLFSADPVALCRISGIGNKTAEFLHFCGDIYRHYVKYGLQKFRNTSYSSMQKIVSLFQEEFRNATREEVALLLLNNRAEKISFQRIHTGTITDASFSKEQLLRTALLAGASFAVLGHCHVSPVAIPTGEELRVSSHLAISMERAGVPLVEHVLVAGEQYALLRNHKLSDHFETASAGWVHTSLSFPENEEENRALDGRDRLLSERLLSYTGKDKVPTREEERSLTFLLSGDTSRVAARYGESTAVLCRLLHSLFLLSVSSDGDIKKEPVTLPMAARLVAQLSRGSLRETVYLLLMDENGYLIEACKVGEGVANSAVFLPRRLLEIALLKNAKKALLAHTHPNGVALPSYSDNMTTREIATLFSDVGIELVEHLIVTETDYLPVIANIRKEREKLGYL